MKEEDPVFLTEKKGYWEELVNPEEVCMLLVDIVCLKT